MSKLLLLASAGALLTVTAGAQKLTVAPNAPQNGSPGVAQVQVAAPPQAAAPEPPKPRLQVSSTAAQLAARTPKPRPEDVATPESMVKAIYEVISGPPGPRDWDRFRSLFLPSARMTASGVRKDGTHVVSELSPEEYVTLDGPYFQKNPFFERALHTRMDHFGNLAVAYSSYASRKTPDGEPFARGINSMQMMNDGTRWWFISIAWDEESPTLKLPADMQ